MTDLHTHHLLSGIDIPSGQTKFPGLSNSFAEENARPWYQRYMVPFLFLFLFLFQLIFSLNFFLTTSVQDIIYSPNTFDFGDLTFSRSRKSTVIEIDEIFGNLYIKEKKPVEEEQKTGSTASEGTGDGNGDGFGDGAEDLSFYPGIAPPRPVGALKRIFLFVSRQAGVEATVYTEIIIDTSGKVRSAKPLYVNLNKSLPPEQTTSMKAEFAKAARTTLLGARFTTVQINGKVVPVRMELPLQFELF